MMTVDEWIAAYGAAWRSKDDDAAAALFAADGLYLSSPTKPPHAGRRLLATRYCHPAGPRPAVRDAGCRGQPRHGGVVGSDA